MQTKRVSKNLLWRSQRDKNVKKSFCILNSFLTLPFSQLWRIIYLRRKKYSKKVWVWWLNALCARCVSAKPPAFLYWKIPSNLPGPNDSRFFLPQEIGHIRIRLQGLEWGTRKVYEPGIERVTWQTTWRPRKGRSSSLCLFRPLHFFYFSTLMLLCIKIE